MYYLCLASCIAVNQPDEVHFHYHNEPYGPWWDRIKPKLVLRKFTPDYAISDYQYSDPEIAKFRYAHLSDFARLEILLKEGGIYADIDSLFLRPIPRDWQKSQFILGHEKPTPEAPEGGSLCNAWIASAPDSDFCRLWLEEMATAFDGSWSAHSTFLPYRLARQHPSLIQVQPASSFYALDWSAGNIADLFLRAVELPADAYSLHLWNHLWFDPKRLDFSHFHANMLTPDYVAWAQTTYAHWARPYLPADVPASRSRYLAQRGWNVLRHPLCSLRSSLR